MAANMMNRLTRIFQKFEQALDVIFGRGFPPGPLYAIDCNSVTSPKSVRSWKPISLKDIVGDGFLWAVPKRRRSLEKRMMRRFGDPNRVWKPFRAKTNILMCPTCGHDYEAGRLCVRCYEKVKMETKEMQDAIQTKLGLSPVEENVVVLYEGEKDTKPNDFWKNQRVVELPKKRPEWFSDNLRQSSTQEPSDSKDIKPEDLA